MARRRAVVAAVTVLTLIASACGSAADDDAQNDAVASLRDLSTPDEATTDATAADTSTESSSELEAPDDLDEAMALYDQCLQDHGVDPGDGFVVAAGGDAISVSPAGGATPADGEASDDQVFVYAQDASGNSIPPPDDKLIEASKACQGHLSNATPDFDLTPEQEAAMEDAQLKFQQCMEDHGIEGGGFSITVGGGPGLQVDEQQADDQAAPPPTSDIDPEQFQAAAEECQSVYDDYPELEDVFPDGGPVGGVSVGRTESSGGS